MFMKRVIFNPLRLFVVGKILFICIFRFFPFDSETHNFSSPASWRYYVLIFLFRASIKRFNFIASPTSNLRHERAEKLREATLLIRNHFWSIKILKDLIAR